MIDTKTLYDAFMAMPRGEKTCADCPARCPYFFATNDWKDCPYPGGPITRAGMYSFAQTYVEARKQEVGERHGVRLKTVEGQDESASS